jgi:2-keto-3-deoxy-L-rhamnonate aldolase RhmA
MTSFESPKNTPRIGLAACVMGLPEMVPIARGAGFDFLLVDMEHGRITIDALAGICIAGLQSNFPVLARVTGPGSPDLARVLDCGATGVVVPHVDSVDQARAITAACRFAPLGARAIPGPLAIMNFCPSAPAELITTSEAKIEVIAMIESCAGLAAAPEIAGVQGLTSLMIGANDLAAAMGHVGDVGHADVQQAFADIAGAAARANIGFGAMGLPTELLHSHALNLGAGLIVATNEINLLVDGAHDTLAQFRALCRHQTPE